MPNKSWTANLSFEGVNMKPRARVATEGYYNGKIVDTFVDDERPNRVNFHVEITEGDFKGFICRDSMMIPGSYQGKDNTYYWGQLLLSVGTPAENLTGNVPIPDGAKLIGLDTTIYFKPGNREEGTWNRMRFLEKSKWSNDKKEFEAAGSAMSGTTATNTIPTPAVTPSVPSNGSIPQATSGFAPQGSGGSNILDLLNASN